MQMNVSLTKELHGIVLDKVKSGLYSNASEVIREAIRTMDKDQKKDLAWQQLSGLLSDAESSGRSDKSISDIIGEKLNQ